MIGYAGQTIGTTYDRFIQKTAASSQEKNTNILFTYNESAAKSFFTLAIPLPHDISLLSVENNIIIGCNMLMGQQV